MATRQTQSIARLMRLPSIVVLLLWMIVPLAMTVYFSFRYYNLLNPAASGWAGFENYQYFLTDPAFWQAIRNTLAIVLGVLCITIIGGIGVALLIDQPIFGQGIVRILVISPFFVMPPVAALVWKNMILHPGYGVAADDGDQEDAEDDGERVLDRLPEGRIGEEILVVLEARPAAGGGIQQVVVAEREVDRHRQRDDHPDQQEADRGHPHPARDALGLSGSHGVSPAGRSGDGLVGSGEVSRPVRQMVRIRAARGAGRSASQ